MKKAGIRPLVFAIFAICSLASQAQLQNPDGEGTTQAGYLKKLNKKAKYGAYLVNKEFNFSNGKGINGTPVVTAFEEGKKP